MNSSPETKTIHIETGSKSPLMQETRLPCHFMPLRPIPTAIASDPKHPIFFFDLDNTLYPKSSGIDQLMARRIELFFTEHLKLPIEESRVLGARFYQDYGLAIKGLIKHFAIDPVVYDEFVDGGLPLDTILKPSDKLKQILTLLNEHGTCWVFTNAGKTHAMRVLKLLDLQSLFAGIIYCDYSEPNFPSKPDRLAFQRAMECAAVDDPKRCFFFDDSIGNIRTAQEIGWKAVYVNEDAQECTETLTVDEIVKQREILLEPTSIETFPTVRRLEDLIQ